MDSKLYEAISLGDLNKLLSLINTDLSLLDQTTVQKNTILHVAASYNQKTIVEEITQRHPSILYATNSKGDTALHLAARLGRLEAVEHLIGCSGTRRRDGDLEADGQYKEMMRMVNWKEDTVLHDAVRNGHGEIAKVLMEKCPELGGKTNKSGESPLFLAAEKEYLEIGREIMKVESDYCLSYEGREGANVLHAITIRTSKHFVVELMNKFPEIIRKADNHGWLPLHYASSLGSEEMVELILEKEPSMAYEKDKDGMSALHIAAKEDHVSVLRIIVKLCPDSCEVLDVKERTALHVAAVNGKTNVVFVMLGMGVFMNMVNQEDMDGHTALHLAAINGDSYLVRVLAADGRVANNMTNNKGLTTHDIVGLSPNINFFGKYMSIKTLQRNGGLQGMHQVLARKLLIISSDDDTKNRGVVNEKQKSVEIREVKTKEILSDYIGSEWSNTNSVVVTIIAAATFNVSYQVPGGYNDNGMAVLQERQEFKGYMITNAFSFGLAVSSILVTLLLGFAGGTTKFVYPIKVATAMTISSLLLMASTFISGTCSVLEDQSFANNLRSLFVLSFEYPLIALSTFLIKLAFVRRRMWKRSIVK